MITQSSTILVGNLRIYIYHYKFLLATHRATNTVANVELNGVILVDSRSLREQPSLNSPSWQYQNLHMPLKISHGDQCFATHKVWSMTLTGSLCGLKAQFESVDFSSS